MNEIKNIVHSDDEFPVIQDGTHALMQFADLVWKISLPTLYNHLMSFIFLQELSKMYCVGNLELAEQRRVSLAIRTKQLFLSSLKFSRAIGRPGNMFISLQAEQNFLQQGGQGTPPVWNCYPYFPLQFTKFCGASHFF